jgi:hypothetical protein
MASMPAPVAGALIEKTSANIELGDARRALNGRVHVVWDGTGRKHPVAVANERGEMLLVWAEGTVWAKGGAVAWQVYSTGGQPTLEAGRAEGVPTWSLATALANPDGDFVMV